MRCYGAMTCYGKKSKFADAFSLVQSRDSADISYSPDVPLQRIMNPSLPVWRPRCDVVTDQEQIYTNTVCKLLSTPRQRTIQDDSQRLVSFRCLLIHRTLEECRFSERCNTQFEMDGSSRKWMTLTFDA